MIWNVARLVILFLAVSLCVLWFKPSSYSIRQRNYERERLAIDLDSLPPHSIPRMIWQSVPTDIGYDTFSMKSWSVVNYDWDRYVIVQDYISTIAHTLLDDNSLHPFIDLSMGDRDFVIRLLLLYHYGGIQVDSRSVAKTPVSDWCTHGDLIIVMDEDGKWSRDIIAAIPKHHVVKRIISSFLNKSNSLNEMMESIISKNRTDMCVLYSNQENEHFILPKPHTRFHHESDE